MKICLLSLNVSGQHECFSSAESVDVGFINDGNNRISVTDNLADNDLFIADASLMDARKFLELTNESQHIRNRIKNGGVLLCFAGAPEIIQNNSNYHWIPDLYNGYVPRKLAGKDIIFSASDIVSKLKFSKKMNYQCYFEIRDPNFARLFEVIAKDKAGNVVGLYRSLDRGHIFVLPYPDNAAEFIEQFIKGTLPAIKVAFEIQSGNKLPISKKLLDVEVFGQVHLSKEIIDQRSRLDAERKKLNQLEDEYVSLEKWKELLWETDTPLQMRVKNFFSILGLELEAEKNMVDLVGVYKGKEVFIEVKGKIKGIDHKNDYRQIQERKDYASKDPLNTIALLVGNPYRLNDLENRPPAGETLFSKHSEPLAEKNVIGLVATTELFVALNDVLAGRSKELVLLDIMSASGVYKYIKDLDQRRDVN